jgi:flagellar protein FlbD
MIKLTRLNHQVVAINPDHISWIDISPDTTLFLLGGEKILVLESLDELIEEVVKFRRRVRAEAPLDGLGPTTGDPPRAVPQRLVRNTVPPSPFHRNGGE